MAIDVKRYEQLKSKTDRLKSEVDKAKGRLEQMMSRLASEFGVDTISAAERLLQKMKKKQKIAEDEYNEKLEEFERKWSDVLEKVQ